MAVGHWLATAHCLCFWLFFFAFSFCFLFLFFFRNPGVLYRDQASWRLGRMALLLLLFFSRSIVLLRRGFRWEPWDFSNSIPFCTGVIWYHDATMGFGLEIALWKYLEFDNTKCKNWILFILLDIRIADILTVQHRSKHISNQSSNVIPSRGIQYRFEFLLKLSPYSWTGKG